MSFSFNFGGVSEKNNTSITARTGSSEAAVKKQQQQQPEKTGRNSSFTWIRQETFFDSFLQKAEYPENELICVA